MAESVREKANVVVIDDDRLVRDLVCRILKKEYTARGYESAEEALRSENLASVRPGRLTGFLGPTARGRRPPCGRCSGWSSSIAAGCGGGASRSGRPSGPGSATCPRSGACTRACGSGEQLVYLGRLCGRASRGRRRRTVDTWLERLGLADRRDDRLDALSHGNQQRVQLIAALVQRARPARARRAVLRPRPDRHRQSWPTCWPRWRRRARRCCSPATSSTSSRTSARTSSSSTTAGSCWPASSTSCGPRCRSGSWTSATGAPTPDWSRRRGRRRRGDGRPGSACESTGDTDLAAIVVGRPAGRRRDPLVRLPAPDAVGAVPSGGGGVSGVRQSWLVAAARDPRTEPVAGLPRGLAV